MRLSLFVGLLFFLLIFIWIEQVWLGLIIGLLIVFYALTSLTVKTTRYVGRGAIIQGRQIFKELDENSPQAPDAIKTIDSNLKTIGQKLGEAGWSEPNTSYKKPTSLAISKGLSNFVEGLKKLFKK